MRRRPVLVSNECCIHLALNVSNIAKHSHADNLLLMRRWVSIFDEHDGRCRHAAMHRQGFCPLCTGSLVVGESDVNIFQVINVRFNAAQACGALAKLDKSLIGELKPFLTVSNQLNLLPIVCVSLPCATCNTCCASDPRKCLRMMIQTA
eukprot:SAG31_NODE_1865_length_7034_cov_1.932805_3_plen_149_part_00